MHRQTCDEKMDIDATALSQGLASAFVRALLEGKSARAAYIAAGYKAAGAEANGAGFRSLKDAWADTTTPHGRLMLTVLGGLAGAAGPNGWSSWSVFAPSGASGTVPTKSRPS